MKNLFTLYSAGAALLCAFVLGFTAPTAAQAFASPAPIDLFSISTNNFVTLSKALTSDVPHSVITGNVGAYPIAGTAIGVPCADITGTLYDRDGAYTGAGGGSTACRVTNDPLLSSAAGDMVTAFNDGAGRAADATGLGTGVSDKEIGGLNFAPGVYKWANNVTVTSNVTLTGTASDVWIFEISGDLTVASGGSILLAPKILLAGGAKASNVFWVVTGPVNGVTLGTYSTFNGVILSATQIVMQTGAVLNGRALAQTQITMDHNVVTIPSSLATLHVIKSIVNTGGGTATTSDFTLHVKNAGTDVAGSPAAGTSTPGTLYTFTAGTYAVSENATSTYTTTFGGDCDASGNITLATGGNGVCTVTNTYIPPVLPATLHVIKLVVNAGPGTAVPASFTVHVKSATSTTDVFNSPLAGAGAPGTLYTLSAGTYAVSENANSSYTSAFTGDCDASGNVVLTAGSDKICTITNTDIPTPAPVPVVAVNRTSGSGTYLPTRIVPLIGITKIPTPLALPAGAGSVTYNYTVWNVGGVQSLTNISVKDDKCGPVAYLSGDANKNGKLDVGENWQYSCTATLSQTTTNTAVVTGYSDDGFDQVAIGTAVSTVVVGASVTPPLINITKVPSQLTPFPYGGGAVTYTYTVTNPGSVPVANVTVVDDKCGSVSVPSGDLNNNKLLDPSEKWIYTCRVNVPVSTRNVATVRGTANGIAALGYAFATVLVIAPGLPNTGYPETGPITKAQAASAFHRSLSLGAKGDDVTALQTALEQKGFLVMPSDATKGYLGALTRTAIIKYQKSIGLPQVGTFGPLTKAKLLSELGN